jgi:hypothetical protein
MVVVVLLLHVALAVPPGALPPATVATALAEASALWAPYGVALDAADTCASAPDDALLLEVAVATPALASLPRAWRSPLGSIAFDAAGAPRPVITVHLTALLRLMRGAGVFAADGPRWPAMLYDRNIGRAVGRVMAHEIGHYLLRTSVHADRGLMRPLMTPHLLTSPSRHDFELTPAEQARVMELTR